MHDVARSNSTHLPRPAWHEQPGLLRRIFVNPAPVLDELAERMGPLFGLGAGPVRMAVIGEPTALQELFAMETSQFRWGHKFNVLGFVVGENSLLVSDGDDHHRRRGAVKAGFTKRRLNSWIPMIIERTDAAIEALGLPPAGAIRQVDLYRTGRSIVLDVIVRSLFGATLADRATDIGALFQRPQDYLEAPAIRQIPHRIPRTTRARVRDDRRALDAIIDGQIAAHRARPLGDSLDVLATMVEDETLNDAEIRDQAVTLLGAGYDTTAAVLSWMFWRVSLTPGLWGRLRSEADTVFGPLGQGAQPGGMALAQLDLARRTMQETTRLHPAGVIAPREAAADLTIGGYRIPKGTLVLWSAHLAGRHDGTWTDSLHFDPDRFLCPTAGQNTLAGLAWMPFGRGARNCLGFALAQMELTLIVSRMAQRLDITATSVTVPDPVGMVVNRPAGGAPMRVSARRPPVPGPPPGGT